MLQIKVVKMRVEDLIPYARNARTHNDEQITQIAASIREFGFMNPVLIDGQNNIIAGHGRVLAARKLGLKEVPCVIHDHLTETQRKAYILADNKLALNAGWDDEVLRIELQELGDMGFDVELTGFTEMDLSSCDLPPIVDNSGNDDDRGNRTEPGKRAMVVSIGTMSTLFDYEKTASLCNAIREKFSGEDSTAILLFCEDLYAKYCDPSA